MHILSLLLLFAIEASCLSIWAPYNTLCAAGCTTVLTYLTFDGDNNITYAPCTNELFSQSYYLCVQDFCEAATGPAYAESSCQAEGYAALPSSILSNLTAQDIAGLEVLTTDNITSPPVDHLTNAVRISEDLHSLGYRTIKVWNVTQNTHGAYGCTLIGFWVIVILVGLGNRLLTRLTETSASTMVRNIEGGSCTTPLRLTEVKRWYKRSIAISPTFSKHCREPVGLCTVPPRLEALLITLFVVLNVILSFTGYELFVGNLYWPTEKWQLARYVADRTGVMAVANFPLLWLFAQRNNVLLWVTGWSFSSYNLFHRWIARVATVQAVVHGIAYSVIEGLEYDAFASTWAEYQWWTGAISMISMCLMLGLSVQPIRKLAYEVFLISHIILAVATLVGLYFHLQWWPAYRVFVWPCVAVWAFDRFLRVGRILALRLCALQTQVVAAYDDAGEIISLEVPVNKHLTPQAGQFYYIYVLNGWKSWESHPFTLSMYDTPRSRPQATNEIANLSESKEMSYSVSQPPSSSSSSIATVRSDQQILSFLIRPYDSFTARLRDRIQASPSKPLKVFLEGPYGAPLRLSSYSGIIFAVGGTGITVPLAYLCQLRSQAEKSKQRIHLIWVIRQCKMLDVVLEKQRLREYLCYFGNGQLQVDVYVTSTASDDKGWDMPSGIAHSVSESSLTSSKMAAENIQPAPAEVVGIDDKKTSMQIKSHEMHISDSKEKLPDVCSGLRRYSGRPVMGSLVQDLLSSEPLVGGKTCVVSCGPPSMSDDTRKAVVDALASPSRPDVDFLDEGFGW